MINFKALRPEDIKKQKVCNPVTFEDQLKNLELNSMLFVIKTSDDKENDLRRLCNACNGNLGKFLDQ